jgi:sec-independent protein translocase protein TatA
MPLGIPELLVILVIVLLIFGPKRLPSLGRQLGSGMREFRDSITAKHDAGDDEEQAVGATVPDTAPVTSRAPELAPPAPAERGVDAFGNPARDEPAAGQTGSGPRDAS